MMEKSGAAETAVNCGAPENFRILQLKTGKKQLGTVTILHHTSSCFLFCSGAVSGNYRAKW